MRVLKVLLLASIMLAMYSAINILCAQAAHPSSDVNYVMTHNLRIRGVKESRTVKEAPVDSVNVIVSYFDGLGRPAQSVNFQASPKRKDIVQPVVYDLSGRESVKYLPYVDGITGEHKDNALGDPVVTITDPLEKYRSGAQYNFYQQGGAIREDEYPYATAVFEESALNRVLKQGAYGEVWQPNHDSYSTADYTIKKRYETNREDEVLLFRYDPASGMVSLEADAASQYYGADQLYANKTLNEHNNEIIEYVDKDGRTVCKKVQYKEENGVKEYAATYYIYDDFGNLLVVLPPEAVKEVLSEE